MSNHSGISQISNLSGISSVSRSTSIRCPLRIDQSMECSNRFTKASMTQAARPTNQLEEVKKSLAQCEETISNYAINKLIHECVVEVSSNNDKSLTESTGKKLRQLLAVHRVGKYMHLPNNSNNIEEKLTLLGIADLPKVEFGYEEKLEVKRVVENKLRERIKSFLSRFEKLGGNLDKVTKKSEPTNCHQQITELFDMDLLQWRVKIMEECANYERDILEYKKFFGEWVNLKRDMINVEYKKTESLLIQAQVCEAQAIITELSCIFKMFQETPMTLEAYRSISSNLDDEITKVDEEIRRKEATLKLHKDLAGTEYDQIVQRYNEICGAIEKAKCFTAN